MGRLKYVIGENQAGYLIPLVFPENVVHLHAAALLSISKMKLVSAGFIVCDSGKYKVLPETSASLKGLGPGPDDITVLTHFMRDGITGIDLMNLMAYEQITREKKRGTRGQAKGC